MLDVRAIVDTDITDLEISDLIDRTDARIDYTLDSGAIPALVLEDLSATWTAYRCMLKDPDAIKLGELSTDRSTAIKLLKDEVDNILTLAGGGVSFTPAVETLG